MEAAIHPDAAHPGAPADAPDAVPASPAPLVRGFGWIMLALLAAYMLNNVLMVGFGFPGAATVTAGGGLAAALQVALFALAIGLAAWHVARTPDTALRADAVRISDFNAYLIRGCFWAVLFCGVADAAIAFMRVEGLLTVFMSEEAASAMGRARDVGTWVHAPLVVAGFVVAAFTRTLGFPWLALMIVAAELTIVISRFVFSYEQALMGDLTRYWYAALFLFASAYTLLDEGHVRVDVFYAGMKGTTQGRVNAFGAIFLGMATCWVIILIGFAGPQSIINSPIRNFEITQAAVAGMFIKYHMAAFLGIFAITMLIQFVSYLLQGVADLRNEVGHVKHAPISA